jgi:hypothetical protein
MNRLLVFCVATIAVIAALAVLVVLITPAPDELPSTGPHALTKIFLPSAGRIYLSADRLSSRHVVEKGVVVACAGVDLLSYTCTRLC